MAEFERLREAELRTHQVDPKLYYDYEGRFIKQTLERDRMRILPRVVVPERFATGGHALGDARVFERFTAGPISMFTCRFLDLAPGESTALERRVPSMSAYVIAGSGVTEQDGEQESFGEGDVVFVAPYRKHRIVAGDDGARLWIPETRLWHVLGLLHHEHHEPHTMAGDVEPVFDATGAWDGYRVARGVLGLESEVVLPSGASERRETVFDARRVERTDPDRTDMTRTQYDTFLDMLDEDRRRERRAPRVIRRANKPVEDTQMGRIRYYIDNWADIPGQDLDLVTYEIPAAGYTGRHRHVAEELLLVLEGSGHDVHDGTSHAWKAGDLICIPPMTEHQHLADTDARLVSVWSHHPANEFMGGIEHIEDASTWKQE